MDQYSSLLLIFIDGLGIGEQNSGNPFFAIDSAEPLNWFLNGERNALFDGVMVPTDPRLGVEGRPQSASGQTTILTGINAPKLLGYHKQGFPNKELREIINSSSLFLQLKEEGTKDLIFANAYTPRFFSDPPRWKSASTCAVEAANIPFLRLPDLLGGFAVFHDFTNRSVVDHGFDAPILSAKKAAQNLAAIASRHQFTFYEHFITDKIGHDQDMKMAMEHLPPLAEFVRETLLALDLDRTTVILTSDHGNVEDLSVRTHTLNDVPTVIWGRERDEVAGSIKDLADITPAIVRTLHK